MIPGPPPGWTQRFSSNLVIYEAPAGGGRIRCFQHARLEPVSRAVARVAGPVGIETARRIISAEGEYGALCRLADRRSAGLVFADTHALVVVGDAQHAAVVPELVRHWRFELGVRPRRTLYSPPAGWRPMPNALATTWYPPGFPADHTALLVYPAEPTTNAEPDALAQLLAVEQLRVFGDVMERAIETPRGLTGTHASLSFEARSGCVHRELVLLRRPPYRYAVKIEWMGEPRHRGTLLDVAHSIEPLPVPAPDIASVGLWTD